MEKNEHAIFSDVPARGKNGRYHSAVLSTYAIDLIHFDNRLLNLLHRKQIASINVLADAGQMEKAIDFVSPAFLRNIGKDYSITSIYATGAFHPKINFLVGDEAVMVVFGSGNLTVTGHGKNHEAFTGFMIDGNDDSQRPLVEECWRYLSGFAGQCDEFEQHRILQEIPDNSTFLDPAYEITPHAMCDLGSGLSAALLYNEPASGILQQIARIIPADKVQTVTVLSPFFDARGESLAALAALCPNSSINVLIQNSCTLPPSLMPDNPRIKFLDFDTTRRGKLDFKSFKRQLHAKVFHFKTANEEFCVIGSANATIPGLGTTAGRGINEEFCVIYRSERVDFLAHLGLTGAERIDKMPERPARQSDDSAASTRHTFRVLSAQYAAGMLSVALSSKPAPDIRLAVDDGDDVAYCLHSPGKSTEYECDIRLDSNRQYVCYLVDRDNSRISNKSFINRLEWLAATNPSKSGRLLSRFISHIEGDGYCGMDVAGILSEIMASAADEAGETSAMIIKPSSGEHKVADTALPALKYNPDFDNDEAKCSRVLQIDRTSRLIECVEESIRKKIRAINETLADEEEEASPESGNDRPGDMSEDIAVSKSRIKQFGDVSTSLLKKYQGLVGKRRLQIGRTAANLITIDDLNYFSLAIFVATEICYLNRFRYKFDHIPATARLVAQKQLYDSLDKSIYDAAIPTFELFAKFCESMQLPSKRDESMNNAIRRAMKYAILFVTLFNKLSNQKTAMIMGPRVSKSLRSLLDKFGSPSDNYIAEELEPLAKRYDYIFRLHHIHHCLSSL